MDLYNSKTWDPSLPTHTPTIPLWGNGQCCNIVTRVYFYFLESCLEFYLAIFNNLTIIILILLTINKQEVSFDSACIFWVGTVLDVQLWLGARDCREWPGVLSGCTADVIRRFWRGVYCTCARPASPVSRAPGISHRVSAVRSAVQCLV